MQVCIVVTCFIACIIECITEHTFLAYVVMHVCMFFACLIACIISCIIERTFLAYFVMLVCMLFPCHIACMIARLVSCITVYTLSCIMHNGIYVVARFVMPVCMLFACRVACELACTMEYTFLVHFVMHVCIRAFFYFSYCMGSFCEYRSTDYVSLHKTKEIKDRKQNNSKKRLIPSYQEYKASWYLQKDPLHVQQCNL